MDNNHMQYVLEAHRRLSNDRNGGLIAGLVLLGLALCCCCCSLCWNRREEDDGLGKATAGTMTRSASQTTSSRQVASGAAEGAVAGSSAAIAAKSADTPGVSGGALAAGAGLAGATGLGAMILYRGNKDKSAPPPQFSSRAIGVDGGNHSDVAASGIFLKGRQAAMGEGYTKESVDAYAVGYMDGAHFYAEDPSATFTNTQVMKQAKKLGYGGESAEAYTQGFKGGFSDGMDPSKSGSRGVLLVAGKNAAARGLEGADKEAYVSGYGEGEAAGQRYDTDLTQMAAKHGHTGDRAKIFAEGYDDGVDGIVLGDFLTPPAAFQRGLKTGEARGMGDEDCMAFGNGFQDGYAFGLGGGEMSSKKEFSERAESAGFSADSKKYIAGFKEGMGEGKSHRTRAHTKGAEHAACLGLKSGFASAFAAGHRDGAIDKATGNMALTTKDLKEKSKGLGFNKNDTDSYVRGYREGFTASGLPAAGGVDRGVTFDKEIELPEAVFEDALLNSGLEDDDAAAAYATGRHDGYCYGLMGGSQKNEDELFAIADKLGFTGNDVPAYADGFRDGVAQGHQAREVAHERGHYKAGKSNMEGNDANAYAAGYRDGLTDTISGTKTKDQSEGALTKVAKKNGYSGTLSPFYVSGFQDGARDGNTQIRRGHMLSSEGAYAKGLVDAKAQGLSGDLSHIYASGYSEGYSGGRSGEEKLRDDDLFQFAVEQGFESEEMQDVFAAGYNDGHADGSDIGGRQAGMILLPGAAMLVGRKYAISKRMSEEEADVFAAGYSDGYGAGVNGQPCPKDENLMETGSSRGFSSKMVKFYSDGFKYGHKEGSRLSTSKSIGATDPDALYGAGLTKAQIHGMSGGTAKAYAKGYETGYLAASENKDGTKKKDMSRAELVELARTMGYTEKKLIHAFVSGYLAGGTSGGASMMYYSLCDVHRCTSAYCETCRKTQNPTFLSIPQSYKNDQ